MIRCPSCEYENSSSTYFCSRCGCHLRLAGTKSKRKIRLFYSGIEVRELDRSLRFYRSLGLEVSHRGTMAHGGKYVHMKDASSGQRLELNWYPKGSRFYAKYRKGSELDHIGFVVDDAEKWFRLLVKRGARPAARPFGDESETLAYVKDPDGIWVELIGPGRKPRQERLTRKDIRE